MSTLLRRSVLVLALLFGLLFAVGIGVMWRFSAPWWGAILFALAVSALQFALGPTIVEFLFKIRWTPPAAVHPDFAQWYADACARRGIPQPRFGVIEDGKPNAFTYGHTPGDARVVVTSGLLQQLSPAEVHAVVAHELGHVANRDFIIMTIAATVPMALYVLYAWTRRMRGDRNVWAWAVAAGAYVAYVLSQYLVLLLSRIREYFADETSAYTTGDPNALSSALVKIAYGLAAHDPALAAAPNASYAAGKPGSGKKAGAPAWSPAGGVAVLGIASPAAAVSLATSATTPAGSFSPQLMARAMQWDLKNPWARWFELNSTHPLTARRIQAMNRAARQMGRAPYLEVDLPPSHAAVYSGNLAAEILVWAAPLLGAIFGAAAAVPVFAHQWLGVICWGLAGGAVGKVFQLACTYPRVDGTPIRRVEDLVSDVNVSHINPLPCVLEGVIIGKGVPGLFYCPDLVLQDSTGFITLQYRQPLSIIEFLFGWLESGQYLGRTVRVAGWFRRGPGPVLEISHVEASSVLRCHHAAWSKALAWITLVASFVIPFLVHIP